MRGPPADTLSPHLTAHLGVGVGTSGECHGMGRRRMGPGAWEHSPEHRHPCSHPVALSIPNTSFTCLCHREKIRG